MWCRCRRTLARLATLGVAGLLAASPSSAQQTSLSPRDIAATARPAVVLVRSLDAAGAALSQGSGFFVRGEGTFVTNFHVIEGAAALQVQLPTGEVYDNVYLITVDARRDLAILKVPVDGATSLGLGSDRELEVGDPVYVVGNPLGLEGTFSNGLVSGKRMLDGTAYLQISAPISPGSSGGPVLDERGNVIGVATLSVTEGQNLNLAVPVRYVRPLLETGEQPRRFAPGLLPAAPMAYGPADAAPGGETDDEWAQQVRQQIEFQVGLFEDEGFEPSHDPYLGHLRDDAIDTLTVDLDARTDYIISGVCDADCSDLDLALLSPAGQRLAQDIEVDDVPMVPYSVSEAGKYRVLVTMAACATEPCRYGVAVFAGAGETPRVSEGDDEWTIQVRRQLEFQATMFEADGYEQRHDHWISELNDDANESLTVELDAGTEYVVSGVCDADCSDLDVIVFDPSGRKVAEDVLVDDVPMARFSATVTGAYRVQAVMADCSAAPCRYGVGVFGR